MIDNYDDACDVTLTRYEAALEVAGHSLDWGDFLDDCGDRDTYPGRVVLDWLGY